MTTTKFFQVLLGVFAIMLASVFLGVALVTRSAMYHSMFMAAFVRLGLPLIALGILSILQVRAAVVLLAVGLFAIDLGAFLFPQLSFPWFPVGCLLVASIVLTVRAWLRRRNS